MGKRRFLGLFSRCSLSRPKDQEAPPLSPRDIATRDLSSLSHPGPPSPLSDAVSTGLPESPDLSFIPFGTPGHAQRQASDTLGPTPVYHMETEGERVVLAAAAWGKLAEHREDRYGP